MTRAPLFAATAILALAASGCATPPAQPGSALDRVREELRVANASLAARPAPRSDAVDRALLPPLQIEPVRPQAAPEPRFDLAVSNAPAGAARPIKTRNSNANEPNLSTILVMGMLHHSRHPVSRPVVRWRRPLSHMRLVPKAR